VNSLSGFSTRCMVRCGGVWQVQVQVPGMTTQAVYNKTLAELSKTLPPRARGAHEQGGGSAWGRDLRSQRVSATEGR